ncbi:MAG: tetratricopeptide (TPR) repeat protein [Dokdonia sp.]|jgi:tetratricopeptide (TPR) repeat protein
MEKDELEYKNIERYFNNDLTNEELLAFEERLKTSSSLREWVGIYKDLDLINNEEEWIHFKGDLSVLKKEVAQFQSKETKVFSNQLKTWREEQKEDLPKIKRHWLRPFITSAAAVLLIAIFLLYPKNNDLPSLYNQYNNWDDLPSLTVKGANEDTVIQLERSFKAKDYQDVIERTEVLLETPNNAISQIHLYQGVAYMEVTSYDKAITTFDALIQSNTIDFHKGYWYKALVFLKQEQKENCIKILEIIAANPTYFKHQEAKRLLKELK